MINRLTLNEDLFEETFQTKPWNSKYKGYNIRMDNKNSCYNIYKNGELEDSGFKSIADAKSAVDKLEDNLDEDLSLVPQEPSDETPETPEDNGVAKLILAAINSESDTIAEYNDLIANTDNEDIIKIVQDITAEENNHIGMLQKALELISPNASNIDDGMEEAESMISESLTESFDGWDEDKVAEVKEICEEVYNLGYELENAVRGAYTRAHTYPELGEYVFDLGDRLSLAGERLINSNDDEEEDVDVDESILPVNDLGTLSPQEIARVEDRRDALWDKEDRGIITPEEKIELRKLQDKINRHYAVKKQMMGESLNESFWFGKYKDINNKIHKVYFNFDNDDFDRAEEEFNAIIPDAYVNAKLYGRSLEQPLIRDGFVKIGECLKEANDEDRIKYLKNRLNEIVKAIENGADPERLAIEKSRIMDELHKLGCDDGWFDESIITEDIHQKFKKDIKKAYKDWAAANERNEQKRREAQDFIPETATDEQIAKYNNWINKEYPQVEFKYDFPKNIEKDDYPFYVTYYAEYPIYEPAEGGYYYPGRDAIYSKGFNTEEEAIEFMRNEIANDDYIDNWEEYSDGYISHGDYIGEDQMIVIEPKNAYLSQIAGWEPYQ